MKLNNQVKSPRLCFRSQFVSVFKKQGGTWQLLLLNINETSRAQVFTKTSHVCTVTKDMKQTQRNSLICVFPLFILSTGMMTRMNSVPLRWFNFSFNFYAEYVHPVCFWVFKGLQCSFHNLVKERLWVISWWQWVGEITHEATCL